MKSIVCSATAVLVITVCLGVANASGPIAVYALVDKVAFEPSADKPERIRVSGVFITVGERSDVYWASQRAELYLALPTANDEFAKNGWVELKVNRSQLHPPAFFPIGRNEPRVLRCFECSPGHSTDALARPSPRASCRRRITIARFAAAWSRDSADPKPVGNPDLAATSLFPAGVSSGISHRAGIVRDARVLGARYEIGRASCRERVGIQVGE